MKKLLVTSLVAIILCNSTQAQNASTYKNAIGIRLGSTIPAVKPGITYKHFFGNNAVEGILSFGDGVGICGLYEIHKPITSVDNLQWLFGFGAYSTFNGKENKFGAAGIIGMDYKFANIPLNLTVDWKPEINIIESVGFAGEGVGFSARFTF
jgi:hypothetical protein